MFTEEERKERARERNKRWREKNREHIREYNRKHYQEHREEIIERCKKQVLTPEQKKHKKEYGRKYQRKFYVENREAILEKKRKNRKPKNEYQREYWKKNRERLLEKKMRHRREHPEKYQAQLAVLNALNHGELERSSVCEDCGREIRTEAHHHKGYAKEHHLDVKWLCKSCHRIDDAKDGYSNSK